MSGQADPSELTLAGVGHRCAEETELFFQRQAYDPRYCFELFRRAISQRDSRAWEWIYAQFRPLVMGWVSRHPCFPAGAEEAQYFVNRAFERMWLAVTPEKFSSFPDLKSLLRYLQMCVHSVILDQARQAGPPPASLQAEDPPRLQHASEPSPQHRAIDRVQRQELWEQINRRLRNDKERRVVYGSFVLAMKPREICAEFAGTFLDVNELYRTKQNVLERLRRDTELRKLIWFDA